MELQIIGKRISKYLEYFNKSVNASSKEIGLHPSQLYNIVKGKNYSVNYLLSILAHYRNLNPLWLLYGTGDMLINENEEELDRHFIPVYDVTATAGNSMSFFDNEEAIVDYISVGVDFKECTAAIRIYGDSMYPLYQSGDLILLRRLRTQSYIQWGYVYLVVTGGERFLKHVVSAPEAPDKLLLKSHNETYQPFEINRKDITSIFEAHGYIRKITM